MELHSAIAPEFIDVVFDGPPSYKSGRFVEVENLRDESVARGEWIDRGDGYWALRLCVYTGKHDLPHQHGAGTMVGKHIDECAYCGKDIRNPIHAADIMKLHDETMAKLKVGLVFAVAADKSTTFVVPLEKIVQKLSQVTTHRLPPEAAARALLKDLSLPASAASAFVWNEDGDVELRVWVDKSWIHMAGRVPHEFSGYPVRVLERPLIIAATLSTQPTL